MLFKEFLTWPFGAKMCIHVFSVMTRLFSYQPPYSTNSVFLKNKVLNMGMSSLFINLTLKTSHYLHMKVFSERISKWAHHLSFYDNQFSRYLHLKFKKEVTFLGRFFPYEIPESGDKISNF